MLYIVDYRRCLTDLNTVPSFDSNAFKENPGDMFVASIYFKEPARQFLDLKPSEYINLLLSVGRHAFEQSNSFKENTDKTATSKFQSIETIRILRNQIMQWQ